MVNKSTIPNLTTIPKNEQENILSGFWDLLGEVEQNADNENSPVTKHMVEEYYKLWNRVTGQNHEPRWITRKKEQNVKS